MSEPESTKWGPVGTKVAIYTPGGGCTVAVIERITKTLIVVSGGRRFRREDGYEAIRRGPWDPHERLAHLDSAAIQDRLMSATARRVLAEVGERVQHIHTREEAAERLRLAHDKIVSAWVKLGLNVSDLGGH